MSSGRAPFISPVARSIPFDKTGSDFESDNVEDAIKEIGASASPGYTWGRPGNLLANSWLINDGVASNATGRFVSQADAKISQIFTANQNVATYTLTVYEHEGNQINLTALATITVTNSRGSSIIGLNIPVTQGRQLAIRLTSGSADNIIAGLILKGDA